MKTFKWGIAVIAAVVLLSLGFLYLLPEQAGRLLLTIERERAGLAWKETYLPDGIRYVYLEGGKGDPLMLLHGFGGDKDNFDRVARRLTSHYRVIVPDHIGFGESDHPCDADYNPQAQAQRLHALLGPWVYRVSIWGQLHGRSHRDDLCGPLSDRGEEPLTARSGGHMGRPKERTRNIREVIAQHPGESRFFLSKELCRLWNWTQSNGTPKDMVCRGLMLLLDRQGLITLPDKKRELPWLREKRATPVETVDTAPLECPLSGLPTDLVMVRRTPGERVYQNLVRRYHYLGYTQPVGEHLEYVAFSHGRPVACIGFSSAPRHIGVRDRYLGWNKEERTFHLHKIVVNTRFLVLPWVKVPHLASHLLGRIARRISSDWQGIYHHPIVWLETFVDPARGFTGTCYKAAN